MFDILSTAELTIGAAIVVGFLTLAMAQTARGRVAVLLALGAWFALVLAIGAIGALSPAAGGAPALGLTVALPSQRSSAPISLSLPCETRWLKRPCRRLSPCMRSASWGSRFLFSTPAAAFPRHSRRARAGAICSSARPPCRSPGRRRDSAPAPGRLSSYGTRSGSRTSSSLLPSGPCRRPVHFRFSLDLRTLRQ